MCNKRENRRKNFVWQGKRWLICLLIAALLVPMAPAMPEVTALAAETKRDQVEAFVERLYGTLLGRTVDEVGLKYWTDILVSGRDTGANVAAGIVFSEELTNRNLSDEEFVRAMYLTVFDREPDASGKEYWMDVLSSGALRNDVSRDLLNSGEFGQVCDQYGITQGQANVPGADTGSGDSGNTGNPGTATTEMVENFVKRLYSILLGREVDNTGLEYWSDILINKWDTGAKVASNIVFSEELAGRNLSDEEYITCLYKTVFDREPDESGKSYWLGVLAQGELRNNVGRELLNSPEFGDVCRNYNIEQGKIETVPEVTTTPAPTVPPAPTGAPGLTFKDIETKGSYMEQGKQYQYITCNGYDTEDVACDAWVEDYRIVKSDVGHEAKEGYEWRVSRIAVDVDWDAPGKNEDEVIYVVASTWFTTESDLSGMTNNSEDSNPVDSETGMNYFDTPWKNETVRIYYRTEIVMNYDLKAYYAAEFLVPEGYDHIMLALCDAELFYSTGTYQEIPWVTALTDEHTLFFKLETIPTKTTPVPTEVPVVERFKSEIFNKAAAIPYKKEGYSLSDGYYTDTSSYARENYLFDIYYNGEEGRLTRGSVQVTENSYIKALYQEKLEGLCRTYGYDMDSVSFDIYTDTTTEEVFISKVSAWLDDGRNIFEIGLFWEEFDEQYQAIDMNHIVDYVKQQPTPVAMPTEAELVCYEDGLWVYRQPEADEGLKAMLKDVEEGHFGELWERYPDDEKNYEEYLKYYAESEDGEIDPYDETYPYYTYRDYYSETYGYYHDYYGLSKIYWITDYTERMLQDATYPERTTFEDVVYTYVNRRRCVIGVLIVKGVWVSTSWGGALRITSSQAVPVSEFEAEYGPLDWYLEAHPYW